MDKSEICPNFIPGKSGFGIMGPSQIHLKIGLTSGLKKLMIRMFHNLNMQYVLGFLIDMIEIVGIETTKLYIASEYTKQTAKKYFEHDTVLSIV
uniref:Uncharacterized protein n=1 Tax=Rhizophagus irregularis (strain DAOM 181602 / DAOM 197198 / MUCL 43194) TaxID=747089 RepID=U9U2D0_RHIID